MGPQILSQNSTLKNLQKSVDKKSYNLEEVEVNLGYCSWAAVDFIWEDMDWRAPGVEGEGRWVERRWEIEVMA